jgi:hypothetical protein
MKGLWGAAAVAVLAAATGCVRPAAVTNEKVKGAESVVWLGLDYSHVQMIGLDAFNEPDRIFPGFLDEWNRLFVKEQYENLVAKLKKPVTVETAVVDALNRATKADGRIRVEGGDVRAHVETPLLTEAQIADAVKAYAPPAKKGVGLVFIVERLVKVRQGGPDRGIGCVWRVFFDLESRKVLDCVRGCHNATGFGFRNYWFSVVKQALREM